MLEKLRGENQTTGNFSVCNLKKEKRKKKCKSMFRVPTIPPEIILTLLSCVSPQRLKVARVYWIQENAISGGFFFVHWSCLQACSPTRRTVLFNSGLLARKAFSLINSANWVLPVFPLEPQRWSRHSLCPLISRGQVGEINKKISTYNTR